MILLGLLCKYCLVESQNIKDSGWMENVQTTKELKNSEVKAKLVY